MKKESIVSFYFFNKLRTMRFRKNIFALVRDFIFRSNLDYIRCFEYPLVYNSSKIEGSSKILDLGCGKSVFPLFLASNMHHVTVSDIDQQALYQNFHSPYIKNLNKKKPSLAAVVSDSRNLPFKDSSFDRVFSISALEHIRGDGDTKSLLEIKRILKHSGLALITLPYTKKFEENEETYGNKGFERLYDKKAVEDRLLIPSSMKIGNISYFGEKGFYFRDIWFYSKGLLHRFLSVFTPIFAKIFLSESTDDKKYFHRSSIFIILEKI